MSYAAVRHLIALELMRLWRTPAFSVPTLAFPVLFFALFGLPQAGQRINGVDAGQHLLVAYSTFAVMSVGLFAFGAAIAAERETGWSKLLRITPLSPTVLLCSKLIVALCFAAGSVTLLVVFAALTLEQGFNLPLIALATSAVLPGVVSFAALGMAIGYRCPSHAAAPVINLIYVPLAFASGLFVPLEYLPSLVQRIAPLLPSYHLAMLGWSQLAPERRSAFYSSLLALAMYTAGFAWLACRSYVREETHEYE